MVFCDEQIIYEKNHVAIIKTADQVTIIKCENSEVLHHFTLPLNILSVNNDIMFFECVLPSSFKVNQFFEALEVKVKRLSFHETSALKPDNLHGLGSLKHLIIKNHYFDSLEIDLLKNLPNLEFFFAWTKFLWNIYQLISSDTRIN